MVQYKLWVRLWAQKSVILQEQHVTNCFTSLTSQRICRRSRFHSFNNDTFFLIHLQLPFTVEKPPWNKVLAYVIVAINSSSLTSLSFLIYVLNLAKTNKTTACEVTEKRSVNCALLKTFLWRETCWPLQSANTGDSFHKSPHILHRMIIHFSLLYSKFE